MSFGKNIRRMRQDNGWTLLQLSQRTGIKVGHLSKLEQDEGDPKLSTLQKLMDAFSCSPDALLMDTDKMDADAILKLLLERTMNLEPRSKVALIEVIDGYCRACGMEQAFAPGNRLWLNFWTEPPERIAIQNATEDG
ncbi:helix-turn-helix domain-containing protein [Thiocapsa rosea]|uniref:Transcriptional regulator with XRE-family HTH domain n=1 Tax=Thiocapsa rosea TaxID=69360 RepID=A0A495VBH4_9GAMM|nr:helix-turn-helix transcriptional regulator [Thiocapsa rosea]RKT46624.1 transcriptional regulator with XRE-family HTH domain [Thiocapsa rosea]